MNTLFLSRRAQVAAIVLGILVMPGRAWTQDLVNQTHEKGIDFAVVKKDLAIFQGVLDTTLRQSLPGPFPILGGIRGTYLPGYGEVFTLEVNVYQIRRITPFDLKPHTEKELDDAYKQMIGRIETVKSLLLKAIGEYGSTLQQLGPEDTLTVVAHLFAGTREPREGFPSQVTFSVNKSVVRDYREAKIKFDDFVKQVRVLQF